MPLALTNLNNFLYFAIVLPLILHFVPSPCFAILPVFLGHSSLLLLVRNEVINFSDNTVFIDRNQISLPGRFEPPVCSFFFSVCPIRAR